MLKQISDHVWHASHRSYRIADASRSRCSPSSLRATGFPIARVAIVPMLLGRVRMTYKMLDKVIMEECHEVGMCRDRHRSCNSPTVVAYVGCGNKVEINMSRSHRSFNQQLRIIRNRTRTIRYAFSHEPYAFRIQPYPVPHDLYTLVRWITNKRLLQICGRGAFGLFGIVRLHLIFVVIDVLSQNENEFEPARSHHMPMSR